MSAKAYLMGSIELHVILFSSHEPGEYSTAQKRIFLEIASLRLPILGCSII